MDVPVDPNSPPDTKTNETAAMVRMKITTKLDEKRTVSRHEIAVFA